MPQAEPASAAPAETTQPSLPPIDNPHLAEVAASIEVTPEEVAQFKQQNPLFAQMDDARATQALKEITASGISQQQDAELRQAGFTLRAFS